MSQNTTFRWLGGFALAMITGCAGPPFTDEQASPIQPRNSQLTERECPEDLQAPSWLERRCFSLAVPETRALSDSQQIELFVAMLSPTSVSADPVVYFPSTPGRAATLDGLIENSEGLAAAKSRHLILMDPRGTGHSAPRLDCGEPASCHDALTSQGLSPEHYNVSESVQDYRDLRVALGIERWNLLSVGYGGRLALELLRREPSNVRSAVVISPRPPDVDVVSSQAAATYRATRAATTDCAATARCASAFPNVQTAWETWLQRLADAKVTDATGNPIHPQILLDLYAGWIEADVASLPARIDQLTHTDAGTLITRASDDQQVSSTSRRSLGTSLAVNCAELQPQVGRHDIFEEAGSEMQVGGSVEILAALCSKFPVPATSSEFFEPVTSDVPTLVTTGYYDPNAPPAWVDRLTATLSRSQKLVFRGLSNRPDFDVCAGSVIARFFDAPDSPLRTTCASFQSPTGFVKLADDGTRVRL